MPRLRRSNPSGPGITRRRSGRGFSYRTAEGTPVTAADRERIKQLAVPPAWQEVWICPFANGHVQATGIDDAGRLQYIYHPAWRDKQDAEKFRRAARLGAAMPRVRGTAARHLRKSPSARTRVLAAAVRLMDRGALRIGDENYRRQNGSHGLTTLRCSHATVRGSSVQLCFPGKSGQHWESTITDPPLARFLAPLAERPGNEPFLAFPEDGGWVPVDAAMLNGYLQQLAGDGFTAKDLRTWKGTLAAALCLARNNAGTPPKEALARAFDEAASLLGNTPAVARDAYVDPRIVDAFTAGKLRDVAPREAAIAAFLCGLDPSWKEEA
jgi:DNA topoisomerase I